MLNEDLLDPKDREIARLKIQIEQFKKYDAERKQYYSESMIELGQLKSYIQELETDVKNRKIKNLKKEVNRLRLIIEHEKYKTEYSYGELYEFKQESKAVALKNEIKHLKDKILSQQNTINSLIYTLNSRE